MTDSGYELLEHTADLGIRAWGATVPETFEQATHALAEITGLRVPGPGTRDVLKVQAEDQAGLLAALLNELLWIHEARSVGFVEVDVIGLSETQLVAEVETAPEPEEPIGLHVKAATYHQLSVERRPDGVIEARVILDV